MKIKNNDLDQFTAQMIHLYARQNDMQEGTSSPYFLTHLRARIRENHSVSQLWETGVISARRWLVGFSFIALIFFISNLVVVPPVQPVPRLATETIASADSDWDQLNEDLLSAEDSSKD